MRWTDLSEPLEPIEEEGSGPDSTSHSWLRDAQAEGLEPTTPTFLTEERKFMASARALGRRCPGMEESLFADPEQPYTTMWIH